MRQAWRWFGPTDPVPLDYIRQAGATDIVSALHDFPAGAPWTAEAVAAHQARVAACEPLRWSVVDSVPVHDAIKRADAQAPRYIAAYVDSLRALAAAGITTVCYNFMPLLDWTRTDLGWRLPSSGRALRFDATAFAAFDLLVLKRPGAEANHSDSRIAAAEDLFYSWRQSDIDALTGNILAGLPGGTTEAHTLAGFQAELDRYDGIGVEDLRANLIDFLNQICPIAEELGITMAIHPDDPPRPLLGLPRVVSTRDDLAALFAGAQSPANGLTFCTGSLGVRPDNDLPAMAAEYAERIHFAHLRGTRREDDPESFHEAEHLDSDVDKLAVIEQILVEENRRAAAGVPDTQIPFRPDHCHQILDDLDKASANPGYSAIGRLMGLAELRGVIAVMKRAA